jgi:hypothetical protein
VLSGSSGLLLLLQLLFSASFYFRVVRVQVRPSIWKRADLPLPSNGRATLMVGLSIARIRLFLLLCR